MKLVEKCPICNSHKLEKLKDQIFRARERDFNIPTVLGILIKEIMKTKDIAKFIISSCKNCGFIFLNPTYTEKELNSIIHKTDESIKRIKQKLFINSRIKSRILEVKKLVIKYFKLNPHYKLKILDYGGSYGSFLIPFIGNFDCYLLDLNRYKLPKGVHYVGNNLRNLKNNEKFDVILILHTLEHVYNPKEILKGISQHLNENGIVVIQVPLGCLREWKSLKVPCRHINFFSEQSLFNCVRLVGLNVLYIKTELQIFSNDKNWHLVIVATNQNKGKFITINKVLSTEKQRIRLKYYLLLLFRKKTFKQNIIKTLIKDLVYYLIKKKENKKNSK